MEKLILLTVLVFLDLFFWILSDRILKEDKRSIINPNRKNKVTIWAMLFVTSIVLSIGFALYNTGMYSVLCWINLIIVFILFWVYEKKTEKTFKVNE